MKAVICSKYGSPEVLQIVEIAKPIPKDNEVLIKVHPTLVTVADIRIHTFNLARSVWIFAKLVLVITKPRNLIIGVELAGEIEAIGKNVKLKKNAIGYLALQ